MFVVMAYLLGICPGPVDLRGQALNALRILNAPPSPLRDVSVTS
jgi:hypothetical protein